MTELTPLSLAAVRAAARFDARDSGTTTALDVKRELRDRGYWAVQSEVSACLMAVAASEGWPWWDVGGFRLYAVPRRGERSAGLAAARGRAN